MRARGLVVLLAACTQVYDGDHVAEVTTTISLGGTEQTVETSEMIEIAVGDMASNELVLRRPGCELRMLKRGGFGLQFAPGQLCARDGGTWTLTGGGAPNERGDELVIDLAWDVAIDDAEGTATETLRIAL